MASKNKNKCVFEKQAVLFLVSTRTVRRIFNSIGAEKSDFSAWEMSCYVIKAMDNV